MTPEPVTMGIDVGTTRIKAEVVALDGAELHTEAAPTPWRHSTDGPQAEVGELGDVAIGAAAAAAEWAAAHDRRVVALAVTGMAETGALLDGDGAPLAPAFAWHHTLGDPSRVQEALGRERFIMTSGRDCTISPSIIKLDMLRVRGHRFTPGQRWLNVPDYVAYRLTGVQAAEISVASRTGLVDVPGRTWWDEALEFLGAGRWLLPGDLVPGGTPLGSTRSDVPPSLRGVQVATGGHDHPVAGLGVGAAEPGTLLVSLGTAEAQVRIAAPPLAADVVAHVVAGGGTVDWHPLGDRLTIVGALPTGITLERLAGLLGCTPIADRLALSAAALDAPDAPAGTRVTEVTFDDFTLRGVTDGVAPPLVWRRAVEDLLESSTALMRRMDDALGPHHGTVGFGGWLTDPLVRCERRRQLGPEANFADRAEPGAVGAALLAARAAGEIGELPGGRLLAAAQRGAAAGEGAADP